MSHDSIYMASRTLSLVELQEPTEPLPDADAPASGGRSPGRERDDVLEALMIPLEVVVLHEVLHDEAQVPLSKWHDVPKARRTSAQEPCDLGRDARHRGVELEHHERRIEPEDGVARAPESPITPTIGGRNARMMGAVDLDDEAHLGSEPVRNEPTEQRHLPTERDAELARAKRVEEARLGRRRSVPHRRSAAVEQSGAGA